MPLVTEPSVSPSPCPKAGDLPVRRPAIYVSAGRRSTCPRGGEIRSRAIHQDNLVASPSLQRRRIAGNAMHERSQVGRRKPHLLVQSYVAHLHSAARSHHHHRLSQRHVRTGVQQDQPQKVVRGGDLVILALPYCVSKTFVSRANTSYASGKYARIACQPVSLVASIEVAAMRALVARRLPHGKEGC